MYHDTSPEDVAKVKGWGFGRVVTWSDPPNAYYPPHNHTTVTTHVIQSGTMTICYPRDKDPKKETFGVGARVDVDKGVWHEVWIGEEGCKMIIGE